MDDLQTEAPASAAASGTVPAVAPPVGSARSAPNLFPFVTGVLAVALVAIVVFGALSLNGDIAALRATTDDNARAIADLRGDVARTIGSIAARTRSAISSDGPAAPETERTR